MIDAAFHRWAAGFSGCDGGDPTGVWICGIEWGRGDNASTLDFNQDASAPKHLGSDGGWSPSERESFHAGPYNRNLLKLLAAMNGHNKGWRDFYDTKNPFHRQGGYFRANLFPIAFRYVSASLWGSQLAQRTGFRCKDDYLDWCRTWRFASIQSWISQYQPPMVVCTGVTFQKDFLRAFGVADMPLYTEEIAGKRVSYTTAKAGRPTVVITYFLGGRHGLNSDVKLTTTGRRLAELRGDN